MKKTEKISIFISIVLISLIAIGAVSAAEDTAAADDADLAAVDEVQAIDNDQIDDDVSYKSEDIVVTTTGDSGDDDVAAADNAKGSALGANDLTAGEKTFTDLNSDISSAQNGIVMLQNDYKYDSSDSAYQNGINLAGTLTIIGGGHTIDGNNAARIFNIAEGANIVFVNLKLTNAANSAIYNEGTAILSGTDITNSAADKGAAIYNTATGSVDASNCKFNDNTAVYRGGAIYSEGTVKVTDSTIDANNVTYRAKNEDNGGAAIYNLGGTLELDNVQVTNNLLDIVIREGNAGDLINAAIFTSGATTIANSNFYKNGGSYGGAIYGNGDADITVTGTTFSENFATFGAAIYAEGAKLTVDDCTFNDNKCVGVGSPGTESTQGAAILGMDGSKVTITDSQFSKNIANVGGAVSLAGVGDSTISGCTFTENEADGGAAVYAWTQEDAGITVTDSTFTENTAGYGAAITFAGVGNSLIDGCTFTENEATSEGGAIYSVTKEGATVTVSQNTFTDNTAPFGSAISNDGTMSLSENTITGSTNPIGNYYGTIVSDVYVKILDNATSTVTNPTVDLFAELTDDQGNVILDRNLVFTIDGNEVQARYNKNTGLEEATYTFTNPGTYVVSTNTYNNVKTGTITFESSLSALQTLINEAEDGATIDLTYGYGYLENLDSALKETGIIVNKTIILNGNGVTIDGADVSRLFKVTNGATLTLNNIILHDGAAENGAGVYVESGATLNANGATFTSNSATYRGGAIWSAGTVNINNCVFDSNNITYRRANVDNGGAAIYNNGTLNVNNSRFTNDLEDYIVRTGDANDPQLIDGVILSSGVSAVINNSYFENNSGTYGGAITATPIAGTATTSLIVENSQFINNLAYCGAAIYAGSGTTNFDIKNCTFIGNTATGIGSYGSSAAGGAICLARDANGKISDSKFINNTSPNGHGGAIDASATRNTVSVNIDNCKFENNTAGRYGGAIRVSDDKITASVANSNFTGNSAPNGNAIYNGGNLALAGNTIVSVSAEITNNGKITSAINVVVLDGKTYATTATANLNATVKDDNNNLINDLNLVFTINEGTVAAVYNAETGLYEATYTLTTPGTYPVSIQATNSETLTVTDGAISYTKGTYTELQALIEAAEAEATITLDHDIAFDSTFDGDDFKEGIVVDKSVTIVGADGIEICGNNLARVFNVTNGATLTLKDITVCHGAAEEGAGVYVENGATLKAEGTTFTDNIAVLRGGAIYSEGTVDLKDSTLKQNDITSRGGASTENKGGAALFNNGTLATLDNVQVVNNIKNYVNGDVLDAAVVAMGETTITNSRFSGNKARYGGAITQTGTDKTLTVKNTAFEENEAIFGGAIFAEGSLVVKNSTFTNNKGVGEGSAGTSSTQGGAILVMGSDAAADISGSTFTGNSAKLGGAIAVSSGTTGTFTIDDCKFIENTAENYGGAIYEYTTTSPLTITNSEFTKNTATVGGAIFAASGSELVVADSTFTENAAAANYFGGAIYTQSNTKVTGSTFTDNVGAGFGNALYSQVSETTLEWSQNTVTGNDGKAQVRTADGVIVTSPLKVKILDNKTVNTHMAPYNITAVVTDDMGNNIIDLGFRFKVDGTVVPGIGINAATGVYNVVFTPTQTGEFVVSTNLQNATNVETGVLKISRSLTDLANIIAAAEEGATITLDGDYSYIDAFDSALVNGIVIDKNITIKGAENANIINGSDFARLFKVIDGNTLTLDGVTIANGKADDGAGIYVDSGAKLVATGSTFKDNTATYSGGAIYADNAQITLTDCVLDGNDATDVASNNDTGGAAIYGNSATIALVNTNVTNNGNKELDRTKGDLINGVINLMNSDATVTGCVFENNTGIYGGAITTQAPAGAKTLTISESNFTANAAYTGGAVYVGPNVNFNIKDSTFDANNKATGEGSPGYTSGGGAIQIIGAQGTIDNVTIKNSIATQGGAIGIEGTAPVTIKDSTFESNTATSEGGAIYAFNYTDVTVTGCTFTNNDAPFGSAISNDGTLSLSGNTITGGSVVPIANYYGTITSPVYVTTLDGQTVTTATATNDITAVLKDDKGNAIIDKKLVLIVNGEDVTTSYNKVTGIMTGSYTFTQPGTYEVTAKGIDAEHTTVGTLVYTAGTFTELQNLINAAEAGATITLDHDITYNEAFDGPALKEGIVVDKKLTIVGADGIEICGNNKARVFKITNDAFVTLENLTICHGAAEKGAGVYVDSGSMFLAENVTFAENVAVYRGGAIYSEGIVVVERCDIHDNDITFRTANDDNGGAAIYNMKGELIITKTNITNNLKNIVIRNGNAGDLLVGVVVTTGDTLIMDSYFANNTGSWGGAISSLGYMNDKEYECDVINTTFEGNNATFGGAIFVESSNLVVEDSRFNNNLGVGVGSSGTSNTQGGAIVVHPAGSSVNITGSNFTANSANVGGAVSLAGVDKNSLIENCIFTDNTASSKGGAVNLWTQGDAVATVKDSKFSGNTAPWGNAISNDGKLSLSGNTISTTSADIGNWYGTIDSKVVSTILENTTYNWHTAEFLINATLTDDNGNLINDHKFKFIITYTAFRGTIEVPATYYTDLGYYQGKFTPDKAGEYLINLGYENEEVATSVIKVYKSLTDLANIIAAADAGAVITLDDDYAYIEAFDSAIVNGIVIDKDITIKGAENANIINGSDLARLFKVTDGKTLTLDGVTIANGKADDGAGIYVDSSAKLVATDSTFKDNTATYSGGAIYADGAQISLTNCVLDGNDVTDYTKNNDTGGAAIYGNSATIALVNTNVTNNGNKELDRTKGDLVNGVINLMNSDATITGCVFENNTGIYGGAITTQAPAGAKTLTISESNFTANAAYTGGAVYVGDNVKYTIEDSIFNANNKATGEGSPGYTSGGGAIQIWHAGEGTIDNVTIKNSIATQGGAIGVEGATVTIKDSTFTDNTATSKGGAIYAYNDAVLTVTGSTFSGNTAPWGNAISNDGTLSLSGNEISTTSADIGNYYGSIVSPISVSILGNDTTEGSGIVTAELGQTVTITSVITDDNGNLIKDINFDYKVTNGDNVKEIYAGYNDNTNQYEAQYVIENAGDHLVTITSDANNNLFINTGLYQVEKAKATLTVTVANIKKGEKAKVEVELLGVDNTGLAGQPITVRVNDVDYEITTGDDGKYSFEIEGLDLGRYDAVAVFAGNNNYKLAFDSTIFDVKEEPALTVSVENIAYGEDAIVEVTLKVGDESINGFVDVTIGEETYKVAVIDGKGTLEVSGLAVGTYTYTATFAETADYFAAGPTDAQTFTVGTADVVTDFHHRETESGKDGVLFGGIANVLRDDDGNIVYDEEGNPVPDDESYIDAEFTLIFKDEDGAEVLKLEGLSSEDGAIGLPGTKDLPIGKYTVTVVLDDNYNLLADTFEFEVNPKSAQAGVDLGAIDITEGETTTVYITVGEGKVYAFTSYGDDDDEGPVYSTGTVLVLEEGDEWTKVVVLTNDADPSYVGREFYVESDDAFWHMKELFLDEGETGTGIYVRTHESGVVPQDIDGTATITITDGEGAVVKVIENVPITDGKGEDGLPVLPVGEYFFKVTVDADGYDIEPAEFYDCLVVWVKEGTYTDLQQIINDALNDEDRYNDEDNSIWIDLERDYAFDEEYDIAHNADFYNGVVLDSNKIIKINGNGKTISGSDLARIFYITAGTQVELMNVVLANGAVTDNGGAIYSLGDLYVHDTTFKDNKVTQGTVWGPGAIAAGGAAIFSYTDSSLRVDNCEFISNEAVHGERNSFTCGAIYASGANNVVIANSKFENNAAVLGGAITIEDYTVDEADANSDDYEATIHDCDFNNNLAWQGGAINVNEKVPYLDIQNCNFNENKAVDPNSGSSTPCGGAICAGTNNYGTKLGLYNCNFEDNSAVSAGGAIILMNAVCELGMNECHFNDNTATAGGAIYFYGESAEIHNSYFSGNDPEYGGALYIANGDVSIDYTNFDENTATQGGAIFVAKDAGLDLDHCNFYKNTADEGSAIYADYGSSLTMKECNFDENVATGNYGTVFLGSDNAVIDQTNFNNNKGGNGGAIFWTGDNGKVTNSNFWRNEATEGFSGGAIFAFGDNIEIDNCDFNENTAAVHGGAIAWINQGAIGGHEGTIINSRVNNNKAGNSGGAIYWAGESGTVDNCEFYNNEATANGAAILSTGSDMTIKDSRFDNNKAATDGAIYFAGNDADLIGDSFTNGQATMGAIVLDGASISVDKCFFEGNKGMPVHYNILNSGTIESITDTTFRFIDPNIELGDTYTYGDEIKMTGTFDWGVQQPAITMKYTVNGVEKTTTVLNAQFTADLGDLDVGTYTVVIKSFTDDNGNTYVVNTAEKTFEVIKATPILEVEGDEYLMPGATATVGITLTGVDMEGIAGTVIVTVDGKKYVVVTDANGEGSVDIAGLANGKYPITAEFIGNDNYGTVTNDTEFIDFYYRTATFDIVIDDYTYGDVITIIVENATDADGNPLNGMVFGNIEGAKGDGAGLAVRVENGAGTATIRKLIVDEYNVVATFTDETYEFISETKEFTFNVVKAQSAADVTYADGEFTITLDGVADEKLNESLSVLIDGVAYDAQTTVNGTITFAAPDLAVGKHTIEVAFAGNDNYLGSVDSFTFDIPKGIPTITVTGDSIDEGETATVTVTVKDGTTGVAGNAVVTVNGVDYAVTIAENGVGTVDIDGLPYGEYPIAAKFLGNDDYEAAVYDGTVKVVVESDVATFDIVIENITYGEGLVVIVENATDAAGNPLNGRVIGNIENATGQGAGLIVYVTNGKGSRTYTGLTAGDYDVVATFYDDDYEWFSKTKEFTVNVAQAEPTVGVTYADGAITITLDGVNGEKLNETVTVAIDGTPVNIAAVTENGTFTFTPTVAPGAHLVEVEFAGNHNYVAGSAYTSFEAPKLTPTITVTGDVVNFEEVATVNVTVMAGETPVAGNAVVTVNGVNYAVTIGADGKGFVDIENLPFDEYPITAKFLANDKYEEAVYSGDAKVVVNMPTDVTFDLAVDDGLTTVTVSDATNAAGEAIDGYIMGVLMKDGQKVATLDMGTLADGTGTLALPADLDAGDYTVMVTVKDGDMKLTGTDEINFTVEPKAAVVIGDAADYAFDQTGKLEINVTDVAETPIAGNVTVVIDEGPYATVEINGNTVIDLTGFDIGAHIVKVIFTNPNYRDAEWVGGFNVTKVTPVITVTGSEVDFGQAATVTVTVMAGETPVAGNAVVTVNGVNYAVEIGADGKGTLSIADLASGSYDVAAKFLANDNYEAADYTGDAKVIVKASEDLTLEVTANEPTVGEDAVIKVTATDGEGKPVAVDKVNVTVNGETAEYDVADDGTVTIPADKLTVGDNAITVAIGDATKDATVTVDPKDTATVTVGTNDENITIEAKDGTTPLAGTALVSIDGADPIPVPVSEDGKANVPLGDLAPGQHTVEVTFNNDNYKPVTEVATINVPKATPTITVTGSEVDFGQAATVTVTVMDGETPVAGNAVVTVNGVNYAVEIGADGKGTLNIADLASGSYDVEAKFLANDKYNGADYSGDAKVVVKESKELTLDVTVGDVQAGEPVTLTVKATDGEGKPVTVDKVNVTIDGVTDEYPVENGIVTIPAEKLSAGDNSVKVAVNDGVHNPVNVTKTITVPQPATVEPVITVTTTNISYGDKAVISFTLKDTTGKPLSGTLNVTVGNQVKKVTVTNGVGSLTLTGLNAGTYPVVANYGDAVGTDDFNVAKNATKIIYADMVTTAVDYYNDGRVGQYFTWKLVDANGNPMANVPMQIGFNGVVYDKRNGIVTDKNGVAKLQINLMRVDLYTFAICFLGDENHNASFVVARITVKAQTPSIAVPNKSYKASAKTKTLTATFKSNKGTLIPNKKVTFTVNGKTYSAKTNSKGVATVKVSLNKKGTYKVTAKYAGDETYSSITKTATLKLT